MHVTVDISWVTQYIHFQSIFCILYRIFFSSWKSYVNKSQVFVITKIILIVFLNNNELTDRKIKRNTA